MTASPRLAKLTRPRSEGLLRRERLFAQLDEATKRPVLWIAGPPGAGKTSLVASYLEARKLSGVWYQIDRNDADPATFFYYLGVAVGELAGKKAKPLPLFTEDFAADLAGFSRRFFRELFAVLPARPVIVLDNYQEADERSALHAVMKEALEELPDSVHMIAISRAEPPVEFARVRAAQRLSQLGWESLKLTREETAAIAANPDLDEATLTALQEQTTGWAAGVVLMLERLRQTGQLKNLANTDNLETVFDYFADQLFNASDKHTQEMLLRMAYLPRLTAETAEIITGSPEAGRLLATLAKRNLFTDRRYGEGTSYQFHALFRAFLQDKARQQLGVAEHQKIAHSAAGLLHATGQLEDAFQLYVESGAWNAATRLIKAEAERLITQGRKQTLRQWVSALPYDKVQEDSWLQYWLGISLLGQDYEQAKSVFDTAFERFVTSDDTTGQISAAIAGLSTFLIAGGTADQQDVWIDRMKALLPHISDHESEILRSRAVNALARSITFRRPNDEIFSFLVSQAERILEEATSPASKAEAACTLLASYWWIGDAARCEELVGSQGSSFEGSSISSSTKLWWLHWRMQYQSFVCDVDELLPLLELARTLADDSGLSPFLVDFERLHASVLIHTRDYKQAKKVLTERVVPHLHLARPSNIALCEEFYARCAFGEGDFEEAKRRNARAIQLADRYGWVAGRCVLFSLKVQLLVKQEDLIAAMREIEETRQRVQGMANPSFDFTADLNEAFVHLHAGDLTRTREVLVRCLSLGREKSLRWLMGWCPPPIVELFVVALKEGIEIEYVRTLIRKYRFQSPGPGLVQWPWPIRIRAFGALEVRTEDRPLKVSSKPQHKVLDLLKGIVALGGERIGRAELIDHLWPDVDGDAGHKNLEVTLHRLRKLLGRDDAILVHDGKVSLDGSSIYLDIWAFEHRLRSFREANAADADYTQKALSVLDIYHGHLLAAERELALTLGPREALRQKWLGVVKALGQSYELSAQWEAAIALYERALTIDATIEELYRRVMHCQKALGSTAEMAATYRRCEEQMVKVLGSKPSIETLGLYRSISQDTRA